MRIRVPFGFSVVLLLAFIFLSLQLMSTALQESSPLSGLYSWLLLSNGIATLILLLLVSLNIFSLLKRLKNKEAGSRLTTRIVLLFIVLSLVPASVVFYYSLQFLNRSIDGWFNVELDAAMDDVLELSHASLEQRMSWNLKQSQQIAQQLKMEFFDTDRVIEERTGADIDWIFDLEGEEGFRLREEWKNCPYYAD